MSVDSNQPQDPGEQAVETLLKLLDSPDDAVRLKAILDYPVGVPQT